MRPARGIANLVAMTTEPPKSPPSEAPPPDAEPSSASKDLAEGLNLMLNAARKAIKKVDRQRLEDAGRRAMKNLETIDAKKVGAIGIKAARNLDPRKVEEVAEEAGRELISVVERITDRLDHIVSGAIQGAREGVKASERPPPVETKPADEPGKSPTGETKPPSDDDTGAPPRVRV